MVRLRKFISITGMIASQFLQKTRREQRSILMKDQQQRYSAVKKAESPSVKTLSIKLEEQ